MNFLENNPFYLLDVMPTDTRATIVAKAEEKSFQLGDDVCSEAQASLLNPSKRLSAEIDWLCDCDRMDVFDICLHIRYKVRICTYNLTGLSKLNAELFNFAISDFDNEDEDYGEDDDEDEEEDEEEEDEDEEEDDDDENYAEDDGGDYDEDYDDDDVDIRSAIEDIDKQYSAIDEVSIAGVINACRSKAGLLPVSCDEVGRELKKKREQIKHLISDKILSMDEDGYIGLVASLAFEYEFEDHKNGVIIDDIVDQYELRMHTSIEKASDEITTAIARIKRIVNKEGIEANLTGIIRKVKKWEDLVTPLQLKSNACGVGHRISENIGWKIRNFAMWLNDEQNMTEQALTFNDSMQTVFVYVESIWNVLNDDGEMLSEILNHKHDMSDEDWALLEPLLPDGDAQDNRTFINAVFWILRTGAPWSELPADYGSWNSVNRRFRKWREMGVWEKVLYVLIDLPEYEWLMIGVSETDSGSGAKERTKAKAKYILPWMRMICRSDYLSQRISKLMVLRRLSD